MFLYLLSKTCRDEHFYLNSDFLFLLGKKITCWGVVAKRFSSVVDSSSKIYKNVGLNPGSNFIELLNTRVCLA